MSGGDRTLLVDASVLITLAEVGDAELLVGMEGDVVVSGFVAAEVTDDPAARWLEAASGSEGISIDDRVSDAKCVEAAAHLGVDVPDSWSSPDWMSGDVALLAHALEDDACVMVTDDRPLRETCKALSIPVSGSIGVLVRGVERGDIGAENATETLYAMDEVGARLSASLLRRAETLIDEAADDP